MPENFGEFPSQHANTLSTCSFDDAATMPTVFVTVDTAINELAAATSADRVLVHAAAGGVGLAAMQVIAGAGATVVATAGSPNKRALLRTLGASHVVSSRNTAFAAEAAEVGGASVVLNSLTSAGMVAGSLAALGVGGRFVEISKRDIWSTARVAQGEGRRHQLSPACCTLSASALSPVVAFPA